MDIMLSAKEGADRLWKRRQEKGLKRWEANDPVGSEDESLPAYTCENCGEHEFVVSYKFDEQGVEQEILACSCGETDIAATANYLVTRAWTWRGDLDNEHRIYYEHGEKELEDVEREKVVEEIICDSCYGELDGAEWESEEADEWSTDKATEYFEVRCGECDHEVEFGWSHPEGGRIWPCESTDFEPSHCIPEKRFIPDWARRDWLRPLKKN